MDAVDIFQRYKKCVFGIREHGILRSTGFALFPNTVVSVSHPIEFPDQISIENEEGSVIPARVIGWDNRYDLVVFHAEGINEVVEAESTDHIVPGLDAYSMGYDEHGPRIHRGIIAQIHKKKALSMGGILQPSLEIDGVLPTTMSGGFVLDNDGKVVGMNSHMPRGVGMTLEINQLVELCQEIQKNGTAKPAYLGIISHPDSEYGGLRIEQVDAGSPAAQAGILPEDVVTHMADTRVDHPRELFFILKSLVAGQRVTLKLYRNQAPVTLDVVLGEQ